MKPEKLFKKLFTLSLIPTIVFAILSLIFLLRMITNNTKLDFYTFKYEDEGLYTGTFVFLFIVFLRLSFYFYQRCDYYTYR